MKQLNSRRCFFDGLINTLAYTNLYLGKKSWGEKITRRTWRSFQRHPTSFSTGRLSAIVTEAGIATTCVVTDHPKYLLVDLAIKLIPRAAEIVAKGYMRRKTPKTNI